ncbi:MAG: hypothetical protein EOM59_06575 [Clostridia bacterium]|nr:hypothetical protein [Clostridia bacterium]
MRNKILSILLIALFTVSSYFAGNAASVKEAYAAPANSYIGQTFISGDTAPKSGWYRFDAYTGMSYLDKTITTSSMVPSGSYYTEGPTTTSNVTIGYPAVHVFGLRYMNAGEPFDFTKIGAAKPSAASYTTGSGSSTRSYEYYGDTLNYRTDTSDGYINEVTGSGSSRVTHYKYYSFVYPGYFSAYGIEKLSDAPDMERAVLISTDDIPPVDLGMSGLTPISTQSILAQPVQQVSEGGQQSQVPQSNYAGQVMTINVIKGKAFDITINRYDGMDSVSQSGVRIVDDVNGDGVIRVTGTLTTLGYQSFIINGRLFIFHVVNEPDSSNVTVVFN